MSLPQSEELKDPALVAEVELARAAAQEEAGDEEVGAHVDTQIEGGAAVTHLFEAAKPGYRGWRWAATVSSAGPGTHVTVSEVVLLPGPDALVAPEWVPWENRVRAGDLGVGDLLPTAPDDPRLVPAYVHSDDEAVEDVALEAGLGRVRVMARPAREDTAARWRDSPFGPRSDMARSAPARCGTCGFYLPLAGSLRAAFGTCGNEISPADGHVVHTEYGCGAHSEAEVEQVSPVLVANLIYDDAQLDVEPVVPAAEAALAEAAAPEAEPGEAAPPEAEAAPAEAAPEAAPSEAVGPDAAPGEAKTEPSAAAEPAEATFTEGTPPEPEPSVAAEPAEATFTEGEPPETEPTEPAGPAPSTAAEPAHADSMPSEAATFTEAEPFQPAALSESPPAGAGPSESDAPTPAADIQPVGATEAEPSAAGESAQAEPAGAGSPEAAAPTEAALTEAAANTTQVEPFETARTEAAATESEPSTVGEPESTEAAPAEAEATRAEPIETAPAQEAPAEATPVDSIDTEPSEGAAWTTPTTGTSVDQSGTDPRPSEG